ncbi:Hypothetical protein HDN1F_24300 [gamma proteobacterium HdN1]|nr:Hypothetical protein HDN1F_24300 [gamma proteobacterium HdN1]
MIVLYSQQLVFARRLKMKGNFGKWLLLCIFAVSAALFVQRPALAISDGEAAILGIAAGAVAASMVHDRNKRHHKKRMERRHRREHYMHDHYYHDRRHDRRYERRHRNERHHHHH